MMEALGGAAIAMVILYGGHQVIGGARTPGAFFSFITALLLAYQPAKEPRDPQRLIAGGPGGGAADVRGARPRAGDPRRARRAAAARRGGEVRFEAVRFGYQPGTVGARRHLADRSGRQHGRAGRAVRRRQIDDAQPDPALLRRRCRPHR